MIYKLLFHRRKTRPSSEKSSDFQSCVSAHTLSSARGRELQRRHRRFGCHRFAVGDLQQPVDHFIERVIDLHGPGVRGDGAFHYPSGLFAIGLDELDVAATSGGGELNEHIATLLARKVTSSLRVVVANLPSQRFCGHDPQTSAVAGGACRKGSKIGGGVELGRLESPAVGSTAGIWLEVNIFLDDALSMPPTCICPSTSTCQPQARRRLCCCFPHETSRSPFL